MTNKFLEAHCSPESVLPTSTWLSCPTDPSTARTWFLSLWNLTIAPHILDSVREGLQLYGRRARWVLSKRQKCQISPRGELVKINVKLCPNSKSKNAKNNSLSVGKTPLTGCLRPGPGLPIQGEKKFSSKPNLKTNLSSTELRR